MPQDKCLVLYVYKGHKMQFTCYKEDLEKRLLKLRYNVDEIYMPGEWHYDEDEVPVPVPDWSE